MRTLCAYIFMKPCPQLHFSNLHFTLSPSGPALWHFPWGLRKNKCKVFLCVNVGKAGLDGWAKAVTSRPPSQPEFQQSCFILFNLLMAISSLVFNIEYHIFGNPFPIIQISGLASHILIYTCVPQKFISTVNPDAIRHQYII